MNGCQVLQDLMIAHLTTPLQAVDRDRLLNHVAVCVRCRRYWREINKVITTLAYALPLTPPPMDLRERIIQRVRKEIVAGSFTPTLVHREDGATVEGRGFARKRTNASPRNWWRRGAAAAMAFVLILQFAFLWRLIQEHGHLRTLVADFQRGMTASATLLGEGSLLPEWVIRMDKGAGFDQAWGHATLYSTRYGSVLVLAVGGLSPLDHGAVYRAWLGTDHERLDAGAMRPDSAGFAALILQLQDFSYDTIGITLEPDATETGAPRGPRVLFASNSQIRNRPTVGGGSGYEAKVD